MISEPENYGMTPAQTLAHVSTSEKTQRFDAFWAEFREEVDALPTSWAGEPDPEAATEVVIPSLRSVRVCAQVTLPPTAPRGVVVALHGYAIDSAFDEDPDAEPWAEHGLVTVRLRVRGFPPSVLDIDDCREEWILRGIEAPEAWILRGAVADVVQAVRCARRSFGADLPFGIYGESLGGGLAVMAAAQLQALGAPPFRLAIAMPTFGDWGWRLDRYCNGSGGEVNRWIEAHRDLDRAKFVRTLGLGDASIHAPEVQCPVLCKLAHRDDAVPAPSAAAIFNALASTRKWKFETGYGHYDGGLADLRRHALFGRIHPSFLDPETDPEIYVAAHEDQLTL